jgi:hypothetical protein
MCKVLGLWAAVDHGLMGNKCGRNWWFHPVSTNFYIPPGPFAIKDYDPGLRGWT